MYGSAPVERRRMAASAEDASQGSRRRLVTGSAWFLIALGCIALAVVEHQRGKRQELAVSCFEEGEEGEPGLPPCRPSVGPLYDDSRDIYTFGGEARDSFLPKASIDKYRQPGDVEGDEPGNYAEDSMYNLYGLLTSDRTRPFFDHARYAATQI